MQIALLLMLSSIVFANSNYPLNRHILLVSLPIRGHFVPIQRIAEELVSQGHRVTIAVHESYRKHASAIHGLEIIEIPGDYMFIDQLEDISRDFVRIRANFQLFSNVYAPLWENMYDSLVTYLSQKIVKPHVMVIDVACVPAIDAAEKFNIPLIINSPSLLISGIFPMTEMLPASGLGIRNMRWNWTQSIAQYLTRKALMVGMFYRFIELNQDRIDRGLSPYYSQYSIFSNVTLLVNSAIGFEFHHALSPNIKYIGPLIPRLYGGKLSRQVTRFLNGSVSLQSRPVIAIFTDSYSMASMDPDQIIALANGLVNAKVRVLWALPITQRIFLPSRLGLSFKLVSKLNYLNVLRHSNVKMTISNCGLASVQESLYFTKPVLCIPVIADQFDVASRLEDSGAGLQVSNQTFSSAEITNLVGILLNEQTFHSNASRISTLFRKMGGIKDVVSEINSKASITSTLLSSKANTPELQETNITSILALIICISIYFFLKISNRSRKTL